MHTVSGLVSCAWRVRTGRLQSLRIPRELPWFAFHRRARADLGNPAEEVRLGDANVGRGRVCCDLQGDRMVIEGHPLVHPRRHATGRALSVDSNARIVRSLYPSPGRSSQHVVERLALFGKSATLILCRKICRKQCFSNLINLSTAYVHRFTRRRRRRGPAHRRAR